MSDSPKKHRNEGIRKVCGCPHRKWSHCAHPWHFSFQWKGTHHRYSLDRIIAKPIKTKTEAATEAERLRIAIREGTFRKPGDVEPVTKETLTLRQLFDLYEERVIKARGDVAVTAYGYAAGTIVKTLVPALSGTPLPFGDWLLTAITTDAIEQFRDIRAAASGKVSTNLGT